ncbi:HAD family hydrolase [Hippea alviniae]|uniref:HAD family hydrolase n=1 Tax=Hippea alviniae TaxID=1279027 RepID=UPI0003B6F8BC|nr:HAD hydrolase family protein [Hippea alviniae]
MIEVHIPSYGVLKLKKAVFDFNGTLANSGVLVDSVKNAMDELSKSLKIYVLTGDTFSSASSQLEILPCDIVIAPKENQREFKKSFIYELGCSDVVAIGNGRNDAEMLKSAALGIAVDNGEGIAVQTLLSADIVVYGIDSVFELLLNPTKLIATLRG